MNAEKQVGWTVTGTLAFFLLGNLIPRLMPMAAFLAWVVPVLSWQTMAKNARRQALFLLFSGIVAVLFAARHGVFLGWNQIFTSNIPLLAMFTAVSFLTLTNLTEDNSSLPKGRSAVVLTAVGTHFIGAVINLSVLFIVGDRVKTKGTLSRDQLILLGRCFTAAAWWSPFFVATGVALTYAPDMRWKETLAPGVIMSGIAICYTLVEVCFYGKPKFPGYPLKKESLVVPLFMASMVLFIHHLWHDIGVLLLICLLAPVGTVMFMKGRPRGASLQHFIENRLFSVSGSFALFLAAGVFSTGIQSIILVYPSTFTLHLSNLGPLWFAILSGAMIIAGIIGVHPVVSISVISPLLLPFTPDHSQLGFLFLTTWAISTCSSPLSGVGLMMTGRFQIQPRVIMQSNLLYAVAMWAMASQVNFLFFVL